MNEAETRAEHIDPALKAAGWGVVEASRVLREHGITLGRLQPSAGSGGKGGLGMRAKAEIADYVLVYRNTKLAVIEAKAWDKPLTEGVGQAKSYAAKLAVHCALLLRCSRFDAHSRACNRRVTPVIGAARLMLTLWCWMRRNCASGVDGLRVAVGG